MEQKDVTSQVEGYVEYRQRVSAMVERRRLVKPLKHLYEQIQAASDALNATVV